MKIKEFLMSLGQQFWFWIYCHTAIIFGVGLTEMIFEVPLLSAAVFVALYLAAVIGSSVGIERKPGMWPHPHRAFEIRIRSTARCDSFLDILKVIAKALAIGLTVITSFFVLTSPPLMTFANFAVGMIIASFITAIVAGLSEIR